MYKKQRFGIICDQCHELICKCEYHEARRYSPNDRRIQKKIEEVKDAFAELSLEIRNQDLDVKQKEFLLRECKKRELVEINKLRLAP